MLNELTLETPYEFDPRLDISEIIIVGAGGTGSQVVRSIARMIYDMKERNLKTPDITIVDHDIVEAKNVGRQMFTEADVGCYKAAVLGRRFNLQLGLDIVWYTEKFNWDKLNDKYFSNYLIVGCVDNHLARRSIAEANQLWIDCGNHFDSGQVIIGNSKYANRIKVYNRNEHYRPGMPYVSDLPHAGLLFPDLLEPESTPQPAISCADLTQRGDQHLLINDSVAQVAATYVYALLHRQPITTFATFVNLNPYQIKSEPITQSALSRYVDGITLE